jgi:hypothetical protein
MANVSGIAGKKGGLMRSSLLWRSLVLLPVLTGVSWSTAPAARAETITLDQGYVTVADQQWMFRFAIGNAQFSASTVPPLQSFIGSGFDIGCAALACVPGQHLEMNNGSGGPVRLGIGNVYYHGTPFNDVAFTGQWRFLSRGANAPRDGSPTWSPRVPFTFFGTLTGTSPASLGPPDVFSVHVRGNGVAHADLLLEDPGYAFAPGGTFTYKFNGSSVTPEPSSLLLIGTGAAVAWKRRRFTARAPSR